MSRFDIKDIDGNVLFFGYAKSKRALLIDLMGERKSFARADFSRMNLSNLDLCHIFAPGASFKGADLRGTLMSNSYVPGSNFTGCLMAGANLENGFFNSCNFNEANMSLVKSRCASYHGARFMRTNLSGALLSSCIMSHCTASRINFSNADMSNANMSLSAFWKCDFSGAIFSPRMLRSEGRGVLSAKRITELSAHLPNRTLGAVVSACKYSKETVLHKAVPALLFDRRVGRAAKYLLWTASTASVVLGGERIVDMVKDTEMASQLGSNWGVIGALGVAYFAKDVVGELVRDVLEERLTAAVHAVETAVLDLSRACTRYSSLVAMVGRKLSLAPLHLALMAKAPEARARGLSGAFRAFTTDIGHIIVCDRSHLALAMATLSSNRGSTFRSTHDIVLMRTDCDALRGKTTPCVVSFLKDGRTSAVWPHEDKGHITTVYNRSGALTSCFGPDGLPCSFANTGLPKAAEARFDAYMEYEMAILAEHGLQEFSYDRSNHFIQAGADGSIIVQSSNAHRVDNGKGQPAIIRPDDTGIMVTNGQIRGEWTTLPKSDEPFISSEITPAMI